MKKNDLLGRVYSNWTVIAAAPTCNGRSMWLCRCVCGTERVAQGSNLSNRLSGSCGCRGKTNLTHKRCPGCSEWKVHGEFYPARTAPRGAKLGVYCKVCTARRSVDGYRNNRERRLASSKRNRDKLRDEVLAAYGGRCACCGESRSVFLTIDHIFGGGTKELEATSSKTFYRMLRNRGFPKDEFQCLCHNCNFAKHVTRGRCPHKSAVWADSAGALSFGG